MISIQSVAINFGSKPLFSDANIVINSRDRIALVGKNGAGKSTLLKMICGLQSPDNGVISRPTDLKIGYLPQVMKIVDGSTIWQETIKVFNHLIETKAKLLNYEQLLSQHQEANDLEFMRLSEEYTELNDYFSISGGNQYEAETEKALIGLGFKRSDFNRPTSELSGGWRMRIELAKILLSNPDVLLLDEPTNHLDIESIEWLEKFLTTSRCAVVIVSHDRAFINNVTNRTIEISCGKIIDYNVKYDEYLKLRAERNEQQKRAYENQQKEIADIKDFIERFRYKPTKAVQVQSRIKQLEKIVPIEIDEIDRKTIHLKFPPCERSGDYPIICNDLSKSYGNHLVFSNVNLTIKRGEKVAFVGKNGEGKSTLVKCIMNEIGYEGRLKIGHNINIGYFAQNQAQQLDENISVFETIDRVATGDIRKRINDILGAFMFGGEASEKKVKVLSGGERSRLAMIRLLLESVNMLILDEPTNHLDMASKEVLKEAIKSFDGTAVIVSHDRYFLDGLVDKVYEFSNGNVIEHLGGIYDFLEKLNISTLSQLNSNKIEKSEHKSKTKDFGKEEYLEEKEKKKKRNRLDKSIVLIEKQIEKKEKELETLDELLMQPENASDLKLVEQYSNLKHDVDSLVEEWEKLELEKDKIE